MADRAVCIVTNEMYPFLRGGIARLMYNFAMKNAEAGHPVDLHFLLPGGPILDPDTKAQVPREAIAARYEGLAGIHFAPTLAELPDRLSKAIEHKVAGNPDFAAHYTNAWLYHRGLLLAQRRLGRDFDVIEFPDFGGWGAAAMAAKRCGRAYGETVLSVRLHSAQGLITRAERYSHHPSAWFGAILDLERQGLRNADLVVGHVPAIVEANAEHYRLGADWARAAVVEFPPITVDLPAEPVEAPDMPDFVFSSRLQPFKRPDVFVKAAILFLERNPDYGGTFRLVSYGWDKAYIAGLKGLVPGAYAERVQFVEQYSQEERLAHLARSVVVVPSNYESLCLFAFEASQMGRPVILSRACRAFGDFERWREGETCLFFDGEFEDLTRAMEAALTWRPSAPARIDSGRPYWERALPEPWTVGAAPEIPVLHFGFASAWALNRAWARVPPEEAARHIFLVPRHGFPGAAAAVSRIEGTGGRAIATSGTGVNPSELARIVAELGVDHVCLCDAAFSLHPGFLPTAAAAIARGPDLALFSAHVRVFEPDSLADLGVALAAGPSPSLALIENVIAPMAAVVSARAVAEVGFDELAGPRWFQAFARKLALADAEIVIAPEILVDRLGTEIAETNSKAFSAGIHDAHGLEKGLIARLLTMDPPLRTLAAGPPAQVIAGRELLATVPAVPKDELKGWELVQRREDLGGVLVQPLARQAVAAQVTAAIEGRPSFIRWTVRNAGGRNSGVEVCLVSSIRPLSEGEFQALHDGAPELPGTSAAAWHLLQPEEEAVLVTSVAGVPPHHLYLMSRVPVGLLPAGCLPVWTRIELI